MKRRYDVATGVAAFAFLIVLADGHTLAQGLQFDPTQMQNYGYQQPSDFGFSLGHFVLDVVAGGLGFLIGAFFSPLLKPFRRIALLVAVVAVALYTWFFNDGFANFAGGAMALLIFGIAVGYGLRLGLQQYRRHRSELEAPTSYGTAKWATHAYLEEKRLFGGSGFFLGDFEEGGASTPLHYRGDRHLLTVAPTRTGKGVSAILPNLLTYEGSALVVDPKGENALITASRRGRGDKGRQIHGLRQEVYLLDPWDLAATETGLPQAHFNPLDWIERGDPDAAENAMLLADAIVTQEPGQKGGGDGRFWDDESKALLCGVILYVAISPSEADDRTLGRVRDILTMDLAKLMEKFKEMAKDDHPVIKSTGYRTLGKEPKLLSSVMATAQSHTHFLDSPRIRDSLSKTDFAFEQLKTTPTTVYLILPADRLQTYGRWLRLLIQQAITVNARNIRQKPKKPVLFLLDEMPSFGRLTMIEQAYGLMAGFGIQLWGIVQDLSQLQRLYGQEGWQTFISNSGVVQYFGSRDEFTASYFSKLCGVKTIRKNSFSYALGRVFGTSFSSTSTSQGGSTTTGHNESTSHTDTISTDEAQRQLAYPDELMVLKGDAQIIFIENFDPIQGKKVRWMDDPQLRPLGVNLAGDETSPPPPALPPQPRRMPPSEARQAAAPAAAPPRPAAPKPAPVPAQQPPPRPAAPEPEPVLVRPPAPRPVRVEPDFGVSISGQPPEPRAPVASIEEPRKSAAAPAPRPADREVIHELEEPLAMSAYSLPTDPAPKNPSDPGALAFSAVEDALKDSGSSSLDEPIRVEQYNFEQDGSKFVVFNDGSVDMTERDGTTRTFSGQSAVSQYLRRNR